MISMESLHGPIFISIHLLYQVLAPLRLNVSLEGLYMALVSMPLGSLPWLGSVRPKQPRISPRADQQTKSKVSEHLMSF